MAYRDELEALRARLEAAERDRDAARAEADRLRVALGGTGGVTLGVIRHPDPNWRSIPGGEPTRVTIRNETERKIEIFWLSYEGEERSAGTLVPEGMIRAQTYVGHCWRIVDAATGEVLDQIHIEPREPEPMILFTEDERGLHGVLASVP